jgi:hypothetical protein
MVPERFGKNGNAAALGKDAQCLSSCFRAGTVARRQSQKKSHEVKKHIVPTKVLKIGDGVNHSDRISLHQPVPAIPVWVATVDYRNQMG